MKTKLAVSKHRMMKKHSLLVINWTRLVTMTSIPLEMTSKQKTTDLVRECDASSGNVYSRGRATGFKDRNAEQN